MILHTPINTIIRSINYTGAKDLYFSGHSAYEGDFATAKKLAKSGLLKAAFTATAAYVSYLTYTYVTAAKLDDSNLPLQLTQCCKGSVGGDPKESTLQMQAGSTSDCSAPDSPPLPYKSHSNATLVKPVFHPLTAPPTLDELSDLKNSSVAITPSATPSRDFFSGETVIGFVNFSESGTPFSPKNTTFSTKGEMALPKKSSPDITPNLLSDVPSLSLNGTQTSSQPKSNYLELLPKIPSEIELKQPLQESPSSQQNSFKISNQQPDWNADRIVSHCKTHEMCPNLDWLKGTDFTRPGLLPLSETVQDTIDAQYLKPFTNMSPDPTALFRNQIDHGYLRSLPESKLEKIYGVSDTPLGKGEVLNLRNALKGSLWDLSTQY